MFPVSTQPACHQCWTDTHISCSCLQAVTGGKATYFGSEVPFDLTTITLIEIVSFAIAEGARNEAEKSKKIYPGFDFAGLAKEPAKFEELKLKEIKNGR